MPLRQFPNSLARVISGTIAFTMVDDGGHPHLCGISRDVLRRLTNADVPDEAHALDAFYTYRTKIEAAVSDNFDAGLGCILRARDI